MAASERSEAEAQALFDGGVKLAVPFTTKIDSDFVPRVKEVKRSMPGGKMKTRGYRATFKFFPGGQLDASKEAGFSRGGGRKHPTKYINLPEYPTFGETDGRKYRDVCRKTVSRAQADVSR